MAEAATRGRVAHLFMASAEPGAMAARARPAEVASVVANAKNLGRAFQKTTFVSHSGVQGARALAGELIAASKAALGPFGPRAEPLREFAR